MATLIRPGVNVSTISSPPARGLSTDTGVAFVAGQAQKGPVTIAQPCRNLNDFLSIFGARVPTSAALYDALDAYFSQGGGLAYVGRVVGPAATYDVHTFNDSGAAASIKVSAIGPGVSGLRVAILAGGAGGTYDVAVYDTAGNLLEQSYDLTTATDAATWATSSQYVTVQVLGVNAPAVAAQVALAGGADDAANITDTVKGAALATLFPPGMGPGQVLYPGATTDAMHESLVSHAQANNRFALLDLADTATVATLEASTLLIRTPPVVGMDPSCGAAFTPWLTIPGVVAGTTRSVPPSPLVAAVMARQDAATSNPNQAAAGAAGVMDYVLGATQPAFTDAQRQDLNAKGVNVIRTLGAGLSTTAFELYGYRTMADPIAAPAFLWIGAARLRMAITARCQVVGQRYVFGQLDGRGKTLTAFGGDVTGVLLDFWSRGALFGDTAADAFRVDTGPDVNTPAIEAQDELLAVVGIRISPGAEMVNFQVVAVPITQTL